jgi:hypothetical protein
MTRAFNGYVVEQLGGLRKTAVSDEYTQDAARRTALVTGMVGGGAGLAAGAGTAWALNQSNAARVSRGIENHAAQMARSVERVAAKLQIPVAVAVGVVAALVAGKSIGLPAGAVYGAATAQNNNDRLEVEPENPVRPRDRRVADLMGGAPR